MDHQSGHRISNDGFLVLLEAQNTIFTIEILSRRRSLTQDIWMTVDEIKVGAEGQSVFEKKQQITALESLKQAWTWEHQALIRARPITGEGPGCSG